MKRLFSMLVCFLICGGNTCFLFAQSSSGKRLQFVYIDHEVTTPTASLIKRLTGRYYDVVQFPDREALVLYLSNGRKSPTAFVNLKEYATEEQLRRLTVSGQPRDTENAFKDVLETMNNANSHDVEPLIDIDNILSQLDGLQVYANDGTLNFHSLRFDFYIGSKFWLLRNNERIIARLYALLLHGLKEEDKEKLSFNVFKPTDSVLDYPDGKPFGETNINGINEKISIMEY